MHMIGMMGMSLKKALKRSSLVVNTVHAFRSIKHKWQVGGADHFTPKRAWHCNLRNRCFSHRNEF
jgi:hypothetical protein